MIAKAQSASSILPAIARSVFSPAACVLRLCVEVVLCVADVCVRYLSRKVVRRVAVAIFEKSDLQGRQSGFILSNSCSKGRKMNNKNRVLIREQSRCSIDNECIIAPAQRS